MHAPSLKIVVPSTLYDAKGLLKAAIRDNDPVLFLEHKQMYQKRGEVPEEEYALPIGKAAIRREDSSVSIITYGLSVQRALDAAKMLEADGIDAEVIDLRSLAPPDKETMFESVKKTRAAVVVEEGNLTCGVTAGLSSLSRKNRLIIWMPRCVALPHWMLPLCPVLSRKSLFFPLLKRS